MNAIILSGNLVKETDLIYLSSGTAVAKNTIAVSDGFGKNKQTFFINLVFFQKTAESVANHSFKGQKVFINGKLVVRMYEKDGKKNYVTEIHVNTIEYQEWKSKDDADHEKTTLKETESFTISDDDLPF